MAKEQETPAPHEELASRFYQDQILKELAGQRVRFRVEVDRGDFVVPEGATGEAMPPFLHEGKLVAAVKLDEPTEICASEYDGECHWMEDVNLIDFEDEVELETAAE